MMFLRVKNASGIDALIGATDPIALAIHKFYSQQNNATGNYQIFWIWKPNDTTCYTRYYDS